jgi:hypothetical protein
MLVSTMLNYKNSKEQLNPCYNINLTVNNGLIYAKL